MDLRLDHVAFGWSDHDEIVGAAAGVGLAPTYGGEHADGTTEMSLLGFPDGTYLELIAPTGDATPVRWPEFLTSDAGPCAHAARTDHAPTAAKRAIDAGLSVDGPRRGGRDRADGVRVEWDECYLGDGDARGVIPFVVSDRTPRSYRVTPSESVEETGLTGVAEVVVAVESLDRWTDLLERLYRLPAPQVREDEHLSARVANFPGAPLALAAPEGGPLADRLSRYGPAPCAYLLGSDGAVGDVALREPRDWFGRELSWLDDDRLAGRVGVLE